MELANGTGEYTMELANGIRASELTGEYRMELANGTGKLDIN